jgi:hypothetical protein
VDGSKSSCREFVVHPPSRRIAKKWSKRENMNTPDSIILAEIGDVAEIVRVACVVESVQRGTKVSPHDPSVQARAADIILSGVGAQIREARSRQAPAR